MSSQRIASISGVALAPGVSKNGRRYTTEVVRKAHDRLRSRLDSPTGRPVVMRSLHPASGSDMSVTNIAGRLVGVSMGESGELKFEAEVPDTSAGRDVASLLTAPDPYLKNVSIRGWWLGDTKTDSEGNETADDLEIDGLDFVTNPGVESARILAASVAEAHDHPVITESVENVTITETTPTAFADPGYHGGRKRLPLGTPAQIRASWARVNTSESYSPTQSKRIKSKIKSAAKKAGFDVAAETASLGNEMTELLEAFASSYLDNGQGEVRVSGYTNEPADLAAVGQRVAIAALAGLAALDPDNDGDIDLAPGDSAPEMVCPNCGMACDAGDNFCPACGAALPATEIDDNAMEGTQTQGSPTGESSTETEQPVTEATTTEETKPEGFAGVTVGVASPSAGTQAVEASIAAGKAAEEAAKETKPETAETTTEAEAPKPTLSEADLDAIAARINGKLAEKPAAESTTEQTTESAQVFTAEEAREMAAQAVKEAADRMKAELTQEAIALARSGGRKGVTRPTDESGAPKPLHEMSEDERNAYANEAWASVLSRTPA